MDLERLSKFKEVFSGSKDQNIEAFFQRFESWCDHHNHDHRYKVRNFVFCLDGAAYKCYKNLTRAVKEDYPLLKEHLLTYFSPTLLPEEEQFEQLIDLRMKEGDKIQTYFNAIMERTDKLEVPEWMKITIFKRGLPAYVKTYIKQEKPEGLLETLKKAKEAEELGSDREENEDIRVLKESVAKLWNN